MSSSDDGVRKGEGSTSGQEEMYPWWKAAIVALPQLGVQVMWMFLGPNTTPYLRSLGASEEFAAFNNSAGPIVGFFVGPLVGAWSDQSTSKWGRRRPVIVAGLISTVVAGLLYSGAEQIMGKGKGMYLAAVMQWVLDFTVNAMQTPFRALVSDLVAPKQQLPMQIFFSVVCAVGGFIAFSIMKIYDKAISHMLELMGVVLLINVVCVGAALSVARETRYVRTGDVRSSACGPLAGMLAGFKGMPKAFYLLLFISSMVWMGNTVWGSYGKIWFTQSVYPGDPTAPAGTVEYDAYVAGADVFSSTGQIGSIVQLPLALAFMALSFTKIPSHIILGPCILVGGVVCLLCALVVGQQHVQAAMCFVISNVPLTAIGSIPYGIVAVWSKAAVQAGNVGSVAMQMAILNCCITVGQELCHMILGGLESYEPVDEALTNLFIISAAAHGAAGICAFLLQCGRAPAKSTMDNRPDACAQGGLSKAAQAPEESTMENRPDACAEGGLSEAAPCSADVCTV